MTRPVLTACLALALGCSDKKNSGQEEAAAPPPVEGMAAMPAEATRIVGGDVAKLAGSRLVRRGLEAVLDRDPDLEARVDRLVEECRLEPGENVAGFLIGLGPGPGDAVMAVRGQFSANALAACVQRAMGDGGQLTTKEIAGRPAYLAKGGGSPVWFALGSPKSLIVASSEEWLAKGLGQGDRLADDSDMKKIVSGAPTDAAIWAAGKVPEPVAASLAEAAGGEVSPPRSMTARLEPTEGLEAELRAQFPKAEDAKKLESLAKLQMPAIVAVAQRHGLGQLLAKVEIGSDGDAVVLRLAVSEKELSDLLAAVDSDPASLQNPASSDSPDPEEGESADGQGKPPRDDEAPLRQ